MLSGQRREKYCLPIFISTITLELASISSRVPARKKQMKPSVCHCNHHPYFMMRNDEAHVQGIANNFGSYCDLEDILFVSGNS